MKKKGFTLIEVMVVVLIIAGLAAIAYPAYTKAINKARIAEAFSMAEIVREAQQRYFVLHNGAGYFSTFNNNHVQGRTRLFKTNDVSVSGGSLTKGLYTLNISGLSGQNNTPCIVVRYGEDISNPIFTIFTHIEDSRIWCREADSGNGICATVNSRETSAPDCSVN